MLSVSFLQFAAATIISYFGLLAGFLLASVTPEELPTGKKYFSLLQRLVILVVGILAANFFGYGAALKLVAYAFLLALLVLNVNVRLAYGAFGILLFAAAIDLNMLLMMSSLVFIFGLASGSDYFSHAAKKKGSKAAVAIGLLRANALYPAIALILFLLFFQLGLAKLLPGFS